MKKGKLISAVISLIIVGSIPMVAFFGCSKSSSSDKNQTAQANSSGKRGNFDPSQRKTQIESGLKELVTAGTITQAQSDKILEALTSNMGNGGQRSSGSSESGSNSGNNGNSNSNSNNNSGSSKGSGQRRGGGNFKNPLSDLVSSGVITQDQADAVMKKVFSNFGNRGGNPSQGQSEQQGQGQDQQNSNNSSQSDSSSSST
ncbi:hypothetical protein IAI10_20165 [Clostridium sp. 19966]|uniref:hypothetical protein n=1 Tax=Clostridium sp. 19966 TaxID=2768166 RepID=UPI0028DDFD7A|nr:hypothetical protein [Clostridium sp. 19966]MDT8718972.1 hypothetical protein [Clostridium sp. 19966]